MPWKSPGELHHNKNSQVMANGTFSPWTEVTSGVSQGGVVSPYLFLLHMSTRKVDISMGLKAKQLEEWATSNRMGRGLWYMCIYFSRDHPQPAPLILGGQKIPGVTTTKYLGFHLDSNLSGDTHVEQSVRKASKLLHFDCSCQKWSTH
uniref:Reverse transcriptase domain-containing protein n=1 Tax=Oncorhynchus tshawytscha TaxID=74940 RepID=A0A8C8FS53_ONCTS